MRDDIRSELSDNLWPITAKLEDWEPSCDHERETFECCGSKEAAWLSEMDFESIEYADAQEAESFAWSVGYICGVARMLNMTTAQLLDHYRLPEAD